jgi:hypothetical protein
MQIFFKAPQGFYEACFECTDAIKPGEIVAEIEDEFLHMNCYEALVEEAHEA